MESKKVVCPGCHGTLEVTNPREEPVLLVKCPNPACGAKLRVRFDTGKTVLATAPKTANVPGYLAWHGQHLNLQEGRNSLGRLSSKHEAQLEMDTDDRTVSRLHCQIETIRTTSGRMKAVVSDLRTADKIAQKPTLVNDEPMAPEDRIVLCDGDTLQVGEQEMVFCQKDQEP